MQHAAQLQSFYLNKIQMKEKHLQKGTYTQQAKCFFLLSANLSPIPHHLLKCICVYRLWWLLPIFA